MLVATASRNSFVFAFVGYRTVIAKICCKTGYPTDVQGGYGTMLGELAASLTKKVWRDRGYRNISTAISRDMGHESTMYKLGAL